MPHDQTFTINIFPISQCSFHFFLWVGAPATAWTATTSGHTCPLVRLALDSVPPPTAINQIIM